MSVIGLDDHLDNYGSPGIDEPPLCGDLECAHRNPDCRDGKHKACREDAWCTSNDCTALCDCECHDA